MSPALPPDYASIFRGRTCIITGVGRSGTTILGKLIGSMTPTAYLFEPVALRLLPFLVARATAGEQVVLSQLTLSLLFEDYLAPVVNGRAMNFNAAEDSFYGHYIEESDLEARWAATARRQNNVDALQASPLRFVMKVPEFQPLFASAAALFGAPRYVQITRNGLDVVGSSVKRQWYSDAFLKTSFLDWMDRDAGGNPVPWFVEDDARERFHRWTEITRAAHVWRHLTEIGLAYAAAHPDLCRLIDYEAFAKAPRAPSAELAAWLGLTETALTHRHLGEIESFVHAPASIRVQDVEEPERARFRALMERLGYL